MRFIQLAAIAALGAFVVGCGQAAGERETPATEQALPEATALAEATGDFTTDHHRFEEVADGVYFVTYIVPGFFNSNSMVIVNEADVVVVDSHITPETGRQLIADIRRITENPISVLVNTHFHYDHAHGNQVFEGAKIVGHEFTRMKMAGAPLEEHTFIDYLSRINVGIEGAQAQLAEAEGEQREEAEAQLAAVQAHQATVEETAPVPPNVTLNERITLYRGEREIQVVFLGRAHTGGDVVVYLPTERLVFTGDMMLGGPSWLGDGHVDEWPETLENLKALDFDLILPGHGPKVADRGRIDLVQDYYRALWASVVALHGEGKSIGEAAAAVDLTRFKDTLGVARVGADPKAVQRIYQLLDERGA